MGAAMSKLSNGNLGVKKRKLDIGMLFGMVLVGFIAGLVASAFSQRAIYQYRHGRR